MRAIARLLGIVCSLAALLACGNDAAVPSGQSVAAVVPSSGERARAPALGYVKDVAAAPPTPAPQTLPSRTGDSVVPSMIIRTGQVQIEVRVLEPAIELVQQLARTVGGFVANSSIQSGEGQHRQAVLQVKVPASRYDQAVSGLKGIGKLISSTTEAQDVGEEYVDLTARMSNARRLEERLVTLLATRTGKLEDVLAVERELARVREEIERFEGRLRYLRSQVAVSTLTVTLAEPGPVVGEPGSNVIVDALKQAWRNFVGVIASGIAVLGGLVPLAIIAVVGWYGFKRWGPKRELVPPQEGSS